MAEFDESTCAQLRELQGPPAELRAQMLDAIWSQIDGPTGPDEAGTASKADQAGAAGTSGSSAAKAAWVAKVVGATAGLTAAGLLTIKLAALVFMSERPADASGDSRAAAPQSDARATPSRSDARAVEPRPELAGDPVIGEASPPSSNRSARPRPLVAEPEPTPPDPAALEHEGSFRAELELLQRAEGLVAADPRAALEQLERHRREFPGGVLEPERDVLRVEVLCSLGRTNDAVRVAATVRQDHPGSPLLERVESGCAAIESKNQAHENMDKDR